jgi:hypothetical protein
MGLYCGIDLHSNNHVLTVIDEADRRFMSGGCRTIWRSPRRLWSRIGRRS